MENFSIQNTSPDTNWDNYLSDLDSYLVSKGFRKYNQNHKGEDFAYWKQYNGKYQIGLLVYDWRKYDRTQGVSIQFQCMPLNIDGRYDLCVSDAIELNMFEEVSENYYKAIKKYLK